MPCRAPQDPRQGAGNDADDASRPRKKQYAVLVVDDSKLNRRMLSKLLQSYGHRVVDEAEDGAQAIAKLRSHGGAVLNDAFDCILMDFVMPVMVRCDGLTAPHVGSSDVLLPRLFALCPLRLPPPLM